MKEKGEETGLSKERHRSGKDRPTQPGAPGRKPMRGVLIGQKDPIPHHVQPLAGDAQEVCDLALKALRLKVVIPLAG